ncbi:MAG: cobalt-precorrin-7 (C(5))-methyltransferase [Victivallales bacterium]
MAGGNGRTCHARGTDCRRTAHSGYDNPQGCGKNSAGCIGSAESRTDSARAKEKRTLFLASGDPLYNGIGGTLRRHLPEDRLRIHPNPTAFQELFAKLAVPWENAALFSVHGKKTLPWRRILRSKLAVIYCDAEHSAKVLAAELIAKYPGCAPRRAVAGCDIGMESEFIRSASLAEIAEDPGADRSFSILVLLEDRAMPAAGSGA